ncbi:uncharacterized protein LOC105178977 [Sesamum indicum]|uniref:Uncharacterized protein LOC105178977 n=1 Tax=Sesamum indicum TaxID=4182 RepID=A0A6I9UH06_SESIN|nr:uncharacterized protein LOC105178977 [Sesamum indicum]
MEWMKDGDQCSRVFFRKIAQRGAARRILQINDEHGITHTEQGAVVNEFVSYYSVLLGGQRRRDVIDIQVLRPWARHLVTEDDTNSLLSPFTPLDVKEAVFDIAEDKAPGHDGLSVLLDKVISPCQAAFVPGRSIGDNIMLAQELFSGYNQSRLPPRCALKVDIRKTYDSVEWDLLVAVLELFGFPPTFIRWIEECVITPSFSVGLNGKPHGFFSGARGLR